MAEQLALDSPAGLILAEATGCLGMAEDRRDAVRVVGAGDWLSRFPVTDLAVASIGTAGAALADLLAATGERPSPVTIDRHLASAWFRHSLLPIDWSLPPAWDAIAGDYRTADGWIRLHTNAAHHRDAALRVLGCDGVREAVAGRVSALPGEALETAIVKAGGCAAAMRAPTVWQAHSQSAAVSGEALIALDVTDASPDTGWTPDRLRPLSGVRVLDLTRVLAGPVATRFLAGLGADVLRIDPPGWDEPGVIPDVAVGKRCARLNLRDADDRRQFARLLSEADILVHGYRPGALADLGYGEKERRSLRPGLIDISLSAWGSSGPWASRRGFDSLVQMATGIAEAGMRWKDADHPVPLPVQALDHATGYLMAAAALRGLSLRLREGTAISARLSLARTAMALVGSGKGSGDPPFAGAGDADYADPIEPTAWGPARRLRSPLIVGDIDLRWDRPATKLGTARPTWL